MSPIAASTWVFLAGMLVLSGCAGPAASASASASASGNPASPATGPGGPSTTATLAGSRCDAGLCACRNRIGSPAESPPPPEDHKRFEIRLGAEDGSASLDSATLGKFNAGAAESCFYVDVIPGTTHELTFFAKEATKEGGMGPMLGVAEYGPRGPYWYEIIDVRCAGPGGKCTRDAADEWGTAIRRKKRGRIDPCGSAVITNLNWSTSGGTSQRDTGLYRDFTVKFTMEVKKFATQFAPGSTECVPK
ncbi:MAG TPA: hypothetical protein VFH73_13985 [Polyangia bacterium]|jgi:hypothetical protein|nr:hypothetical protein [Polyangia bacterium]